MKIKILELTRIKVALGYVLAAVLVSTLFSCIIYVGVVLSISSSIERASSRLGVGLSSSAIQQSTSNRQLQLLEEELARVQKQLVRYLLILNSVLAVFTAVVSYFLARETLSPVTELMEQQKQFVANASHELKTPLTALKTSLEVALRRKTNTPATTKLLQANLEDVSRLTGIVSRLLLLANQESGNNKHKHCDIYMIVEKAVAIVGPLAAQKDIQIEVKNKHTFIYVDQDAYVEALVVVLDNAIKYSNSSSVVSLSVSRFMTEVRVRVTDTGIGISAKDIPHVFKRFYRGSESRSNSSRQGFGIGLAIAQQIMQNHEGSIRIKSILGKGTSVTLITPATVKVF